MNLQSMIGNLSIVETLAPARKTASENGSAIDTSDYTGTAKFVLVSSAGGGTSPTLNVKVQTSADGSTGWADVSGAAFTQLTDAADVTDSIDVDIDNVSVFVRVVTTIGGTSPTFDCSVTMVALAQTI